MVRTVRLEDDTADLLTEIRGKVISNGTEYVTRQYGKELISPNKSIDLDAIIFAALRVFNEKVFE